MAESDKGLIFELISYSSYCSSVSSSLSSSPVVVFFLFGLANLRETRTKIRRYKALWLQILRTLPQVPADDWAKSTARKDLVQRQLAHLRECKNKHHS
jgi:hypothetical protein